MDHFFTLPAVLQRTAAWYPRHPAFLDGDREVPYGEFDRRSRLIAGGLSALGIRAGDRVAFLSPASLEFVHAYWAVTKIGAVPVPLLQRESPTYHRSVIERLAPRVIVAAPEMAEHATALLPLAGEGVRLLTATFDASDPAGLAALPTAVSDHAPAHMVGENDQAIITSTSGTTHRPKLVLRSHRSIVEYGRASLYNRPGLRDTDRIVVPFDPSFAAWIASTLAFVLAGGSVVLMPTWDPEYFLSLAGRRRATVLYATPSMWRQVFAAHPERHDLSAVWLATTTAEQMTAELLDELTGRITPNVTQIYGSAEITGTVANARQLRTKGVRCIGKPMLFHDARIVVPNGAPDDETSAGETGELILRGASLLTDFWGAPELRAERIRDGWFYTRDLAYRDDEGDLFYWGRADNVVNTRGIKVNAEEVESALVRHPDVVEAAVVGVPDAEWGERVVAVVVSRRPALGVDDLDRWCVDRQGLATFKRPRAYHFVERLPRSPSGKVDRKQLRGALTGIGESPPERRNP